MFLSPSFSSSFFSISRPFASFLTFHFEKKKTQIYRKVAKIVVHLTRSSSIYCSPRSLLATLAFSLGCVYTHRKYAQVAHMHATVIQLNNWIFHPKYLIANVLPEDILFDITPNSVIESRKLILIYCCYLT